MTFKEKICEDLKKRLERKRETLSYLKENVPKNPYNDYFKMARIEIEIQTIEDTYFHITMTPEDL